jgi:hypothetical protein
LRTALRVLAGIAIGGVGFWVPSIIWHTVRAERFGGRDVIGLTVVLPVLMWLVARALQRRVPAGRAPNYMPVAACAGIWLVGPVAFFAWVAAAGGSAMLLSQPLGWGVLGWAAQRFPPRPS